MRYKKSLFSEVTRDKKLYPKVEGKIENYSYLKDNQIAPFVITINSSNKNYDIVRFGGYLIKPDTLIMSINGFLYRKKTNGIITDVDSIFSFKKGDTTLIKRLGVLVNHKCYLVNVDLRESDTVYNFKLINMSSIPGIGAHDMGNDDFYEIDFSKRNGFLKIKKRTEYLIVSYQ
ncbi:MAG: hypothetical protein QM534_17310 [Sediminibacterium sp.]|nr:hypothetical protein [Sediminibacterium sp.]